MFEAGGDGSWLVLEHAWVRGGLVAVPMLSPLARLVLTVDFATSRGVLALELALEEENVKANAFRARQYIVVRVQYRSIFLQQVEIVRMRARRAGARGGKKLLLFLVHARHVRARGGQKLLLFGVRALHRRLQHPHDIFKCHGGILVGFVGVGGGEAQLGELRHSGARALVGRMSGELRRSDAGSRMPRLPLHTKVKERARDQFLRARGMFSFAPGDPVGRHASGDDRRC